MRGIFGFPQARNRLVAALRADSATPLEVKKTSINLEVIEI
jgi:hypothetical protein